MSKLSCLGEVLNGEMIPKTFGQYPAYGGNGVVAHVNGYNYPENTIIIGRVGANCGAVHISDKKCWITDNALAFRVNNCTDTYFAYYLLKMLDLNRFHIGSSQPLITQTIINNIEYNYITDEKTQAKISACIKRFDDKISNNNAINAELEAMAKTIYDYWFLQFDFPDENGKPYKSSGGKMVYNEELKREIPEGWDVENLMNNKLSTIIKPGVDRFVKKNYLATANINGEEISDGDWITYANREGRANMQPVANSVWFAKMKNSIKHLTLPTESSWFIDKYILSTGFLGISCSEQSVGYVHCFINNGLFEPLKDRLAHGATQEAVNNEDLKSVKLVVPCEQVLALFAQLVNPILQRKADLIRENQELASLRDFLLPLLMNGQVGFKD